MGCESRLVGAVGKYIRSPHLNARLRKVVRTWKLIQRSWNYAFTSSRNSQEAPQDHEARSSSGTPRSLETTRSLEASGRHVLEGSLLAFLVRSVRVAPRLGCEEEALYDCEAELCFGGPKFEGVEAPKILWHV